MVKVRVKVFIVAFDDIMMLRGPKEVPSDWLFAAAFRDLEAGLRRGRMGSICICRRGEGGHAFYRSGRRALDSVPFDRAEYEECDVLVTFKKRPVFALYYALFVAVKQRHWRWVPTAGADARDFFKARGKAIEAAVHAPADGTFASHGRKELAQRLRKKK